MDHEHDNVLDHHDHDYVDDHLAGGCSGIPDSPITIILPSLSGARMWELPLVRKERLIRELTKQRTIFRVLANQRPLFTKQRRVLTVLTNQRPIMII